MSTLAPGTRLALVGTLIPLLLCLPLAGGASACDPSAVLEIASYAIDVGLDVEAKTLTGHEVVQYVNGTAEPFSDLVFHLYLNAFRDEDSLFLQESGAGHRGFGSDAEHAGWIQVTGIRLCGGGPTGPGNRSEQVGNCSIPLDLEEFEDGTLARASLPRPVQPGETVQVELEFESKLPRVFVRTGYAGDFFMVGQWFPKLGVWENGAWNAHPFHANAEFYADFGVYDVAISLPAHYVTGATGMPVDTVDHGDGTQTVHYHAEGVIDFAWTTSPQFQEVSRWVEGVELLYLYLPGHEWSVGRVLDAAEAAVRSYNRWYGSYPYARLTVVDVPDDGPGAGGMEYPTLVTAGMLNLTDAGVGVLRSEANRFLEVVVVHEIGHQWWQSMVAFNEAEEPWLDEGFTDYSATRVMEALYGADSSLVDTPFFNLGYLNALRADYLNSPRVPMYGQAWDFPSMAYHTAIYSKPVLALSTLQRTLGEQAMLDLMSTFFHRYCFAHPTTEDFRAVAQEVSGQDLSWFFDGLVYSDGVVNYKVTDLDTQSVTVARQGELRIPTEVLVTFADGNTRLEPWDAEESEVTFRYPDHPPVRSAVVDPERKVMVDLRWADNGLSRRIEVWPWLALVTRIAYNLENALMALGGL